MHDNLVFVKLVGLDWGRAKQWDMFCLGSGFVDMVMVVERWLWTPELRRVWAVAAEYGLR